MFSIIAQIRSRWEARWSNQIFTASSLPVPPQNARLSRQHLLRKIKPLFPPHVEKIICIISPSVRWKQNNNWFALFSVCVVKQLGINLRITVQLILNAKDGVGGGFDSKEGKGYTDWGHETKTLCFCYAARTYFAAFQECIWGCFHKETGAARTHIYHSALIQFKSHFFCVLFGWS